jgi:bacterioferritin (cytochrome b1)
MPDATVALRHLNALLRGELAAVATYRMAFDRVRHFPDKGDLVECERSHRERADLLRARILQLGGEPATGAGAWGVLATIVEAGAAVLGDGLALAALGEGEERGLHDYRNNLSGLDEDSRTLVASRLLPEQERTAALLRVARASLEHPSAPLPPSPPSAP